MSEFSLPLKPKEGLNGAPGIQGWKANYRNVGITPGEREICLRVNERSLAFEILETYS